MLTAKGLPLIALPQVHRTDDTDLRRALRHDQRRGLSHDGDELLFTTHVLRALAAPRPEWVHPRKTPISREDRRLQRGRLAVHASMAPPPPPPRPVVPMVVWA